MRLNTFIRITAAGALLGSALGCSSGAVTLPAAHPCQGEGYLQGPASDQRRHQV